MFLLPHRDEQIDIRKGKSMKVFGSYSQGPSLPRVEQEIRGYFKTASHGGRCCGRSHIYGFLCVSEDVLPHDRKVKAIRDAVSEALIRTKYGQSYTLETWTYDIPEITHCIEVTLKNPTQTNYWRKPLEEVGFKEVYSFRNGKTDKTICVFMLTANAKEGD